MHPECGGTLSRRPGCQNFLPSALHPRSCFCQVFMSQLSHCGRMRVPGQGRHWATSSAASSLDPHGPSFCSQGTWHAHTAPVSHGPTLPRPNRGLALGPWLCSQPVGGSSPKDTGAHSPGLLADPGRAPEPLLASCSVNTARLMVRNCQRVPSDGTVWKMS